jgi:hypothetical protein
LIEVEVAVAVPGGEPQEATALVRQEDRAALWLDPLLVVLAEQDLLALAGGQVEADQVHVVLAAVHDRHVDLLSLGPEGDVGPVDVFGLAVGALLRLEVVELLAFCVVDADLHLAVHATRHRVATVHRPWWHHGVVGVGIGGDGGEVLAVESQVALVGSPPQAIVDAELGAVGGAAVDDVLAAVLLDHREPVSALLHEQLVVQQVGGAGVVVATGDRARPRRQAQLLGGARLGDVPVVDAVGPL